MSKLLEILRDLEEGKEDESYEYTKEQIKSLFLELMLNLVGKEEPTHKIGKRGYMVQIPMNVYRNHLRTELRQKVGEL